MKTASVMMAGAVIGNLVIVPAIALFGDAAPGLIPPGIQRIAQMDIATIQSSYLRYIGAGCVTAAGIISMFRTLPMILLSATAGIRGLGGSRSGEVRQKRTDRDMPLVTVLIGCLVLLVVLAGVLMTEVKPLTAILGAVLVLAFGFLFVTVSSRLTGEIGSSSNPISGMTVATLALTCLIFATLGMRSPIEAVLALSVAAVVCIAASNGGTTSQDLKTGYLVGGTPYWQQWAIVVGTLTSALVIGGTLLLFNSAGTVYSTRDVPRMELSPQQYDALTERANYNGQDYRVWWVRPGEHPDILPGKYYVDASRRPAVLVDPAITGRLNKNDNGEEVKFKFPAPKTQVMGIIINGVLGGTLNWGLVLIGVMLAVGIKLCGVSSLAFAVGVYIPMQYTTPIFLGGLISWLAGRLSRGNSKQQDEASAMMETETGPGTLLASGYIAGGALAGVAIAFLRDEPRVAVAFFGDGATNIGTFHESLNLAQLWQVPAVFVCENNRWAESTPASQHLPIEDLTKRAVAYGMESMRVDGQDVEEVYQAAHAALDHAREGRGPVFLLLETYRLTGHYIGDPQVYRPKGELEELRKTQDPITKLRERLGLTDEEFEEADREAHELVEASVEFAKAGTDPEARGRAEKPLCLSSATEKPSATRSRRRCARTTTSSSWARTSPRWAARWASHRACSTSSGRSGCATRRSPRWRSSARASGPRCRACARSSRSCTRTS